jgi:hypothetical protein
VGDHVGLDHHGADHLAGLVVDREDILDHGAPLLSTSRWRRPPLPLLQRLQQQRLFSAS